MSQESHQKAKAAADDITERFRRLNDGAVLAQVAFERIKQDAQWGQQDWPSVVSRDHPHLVALYYGIPSADTARRLCQEAYAGDRVTWAHILIEEVAEAVGCLDEKAMRAELIQVAAVAVAWVQAIDRRAAKK